MFKIVGTLPMKTCLPLVAWVLAGLVTLFSLVTSLTQVTYAGRGTSRRTVFWTTSRSLNL